MSRGKGKNRNKKYQDSGNRQPGRRDAPENVGIHVQEISRLT